MASNYDPTNWMMRKLLATELMIKLHNCGFMEVSTEISKIPTRYGGGNLVAHERVFSRPVNAQVSVKVYTSIVGDEVRDTGKDAIRVCAIYTAKDGSFRGLVKNRRINRTGNIQDIVVRMHQRMRDVWKATMSTSKCNKCGAPLFTSKKGNLVCAEACWTHTSRRCA